MRLMPEVAVGRRPDDEPRYVRSYVFTRFSIGLLGVLLPPLLVFLEPALFDGQPFPRGSLSAYYYSGVRELFVGGLWAIGVFLFVYKFLDFSWESFLSSLAGIAAVVVALFPTERPGEGITLTPGQMKLGEPTVTAIHYGAAVAFIALLVPIVLFFARDEGKRGHRNWQGFHTVSAAFIVFGAALAAFAGITGGPDKGVLFGEWIAIWAFGAAWLVKGAEWKVMFRGRVAPSALPVDRAPAPDSPTVPQG